VFTWLAFNTLCALPLALAALLVRRFGRARPAVEHLLWLLVLARLVFPPFGSAAPAASPGAVSIVSSATPGLGDALVARTTRLLGPNWSTWTERIALGLFLALLAFVLARELARALAVERCVRGAARARGRLAQHVRGVAAGLGVRAPRVCVLARASGPFLWSLRRPVLVLPASQGLPAPTVVAHELAHLRRRDHWTAWFELGVQALHFWNPLFWLARRQLHRAAELACDQWVVERFPRERRAFARALVDTAERSAEGAFIPRAAQAIGSDPRDFEERLVNILHAPERARSWRGLPAAALACALLTLPGIALPSLAQFRAGLPALPAGLDETTWRESLARADARIAANAADGQAYMQRGIALLCLARAEEALASFKRQAELGFRLAQAHYNQACAFVRLGDSEAALASLVRAADAGLDVRAYACADADLAALRAHPAFVETFGR